jgi:hypothetical protein
LVSRSLPQKDKRVRAEADILIRPDFARAFLSALSTTASYGWSESDFASLHAVECSQILIEKDPLASDNQNELTDSFGGGCDGGRTRWAERDPDIAAMYSRLQEGYSAPLQSIIQRAMHSGELPKTTDAALLVAALTGPLFYRRWFSREPLTSAFAKRIVRLVLRQD